MGARGTWARIGIKWPGETRGMMGKELVYRKKRKKVMDPW
jgi:hypothetical protein